MEALNSIRNKRLAKRLGDLKYNYDSTLTSTTYNGTGTTYELKYEAVKTLGETIDVTIQINDNILNPDDTIVGLQ